jgi:hypothetical protein
MQRLQTEEAQWNDANRRLIPKPHPYDYLIWGALADCIIAFLATDKANLPSVTAHTSIDLAQFVPFPIDLE